MTKARFAYFDRDQVKLTKILTFRNKEDIYAHAKHYDPCCICHLAPLRDRIRYAITNFRLGLRHHYPICCILHYCIDGLLAVPSAMLRYSDRTEYVECRYHIKRNGGAQQFPI